jgi:soluble lytic murein transglycosylase-like protein
VSSSGRSLGLALVVALFVGVAAEGRAEQVYRYVDERGVVHLTNVPADTRYQKYRIGSAGGSGKGILILARRTPSRTHIPGMTQKVSYSVASRPPRLFGGKAFGGKSTVAYDDLIARTARRHGLPPALVKAVVKAESNFQPGAVSDKGAQGLMQLMPATAEDLGVDHPFTPEENVAGGTRYLRAMYDRFGDWEHALAAYNAGPGAVDRFGGIPPFAETQEYVERVLHYARRDDGDFSR